MKERAEFILSHLSGKILDVGFYCGTLHKRMTEKFPKEDIYGLDIEVKKSNGHYRKGSAEKIPFKERFFDSVVAGELIEHLEHPEKFVKEAARVLKPQGILFITTPNKDSLINKLTKSYHTKVHLHLFNKEELEDMLGRHGFKVERFFCLPYTDESSDGARHKRLFALRKGMHYTLPESMQEEMVVVARKGKRKKGEKSDAGKRKKGNAGKGRRKGK